ncbi:indole-3-glycerol-phosphate synthase [Streptomyces sp. NPDC059063]|uniref:indole-3-glycerol phosphate synthase TrpC n=1 Tax=unclassified Streptomyces TaxID=2593676 RepID=UPI0036B3938E
MHLDEIVARKREFWRAGGHPVPTGSRRRPAVPGRFRTALRRPDVSVIAEVKPKSPSKGDLWPAEKAVPLATAYAEGGARAVSVLADEPFFGGSPALVAEVRAAVELPVLFKDFVVDTRQVTLAHACGADAVLVIVRSLDDAELADILGAARDLGLDALVETFTATEIDRAVTAGADLVGVNNRDLRTFSVDLDNSARLRDGIPEDVVTVSESGLRHRADVTRIGAHGFDACLVGETLLTSGSPADAVRDLTGVPVRRTAREART